MRRRFVTLDVFTERRFTGNPLAVVLDADGLDDGAMQTVAREFNLSETVFVRAPTQSHRAAIRIFTPVSELPFAGHPTVGTAVLLACRDDLRNGEFGLELPIGIVRCRVTTESAEAGHAAFGLPRLPEEIGATADSETIAAALSLTPADIGFGDVRPMRWSAGAPYTMVPLSGLEAMARCRPDLTHWDRAFGFDAHSAAYLFCRETIERRNAFHARMFAPRQGVPEDPATGSAAAALCGVIARIEALPDGEHAFAIEQGCEMGRPSRIEAALTIRNRSLVEASIGGGAVIVSEGWIDA